jgi:hypothetical protein
MLRIIKSEPSRVFALWVWRTFGRSKIINPNFGMPDNPNLRLAAKNYKREICDTIFD